MSTNIAKPTNAAPSSKTVAKPRSDKSKIATKTSSTKAAHSQNSKTDATLAAATKRKIAKENGVQHHSLDEKKSDKKPAITSNSKQNIANDKPKHQTKMKSEGKAATIQAAKKVLPVEKTDPKRSTQTEKRDQKRGASDKLKSNTSKESKSKTVSKETVKSTKPKDSPTIDSVTLKLASKMVRPPQAAESSSTKNENVSKIPTKAPIKASHAIVGAKPIVQTTAPAPAPTTTATAAIKASTTTATAVAVAATATAVTVPAFSTKNIMNQVHNVTIQSPPPMRREIVSIDEKPPEPPRNIDASEQRRGRTRTRTLEAAEIVLLRPNSTITERSIAQPTQLTVPSPPQPTIVNTNLVNLTTQIEAAPVLKASLESAKVEIKPAVSFEVMLKDKAQDNDTKNLDQNKKKPNQIADANVMDQKIHKTTNEIVDAAVNESDNYEDDFESYESDFETDVSNGGEGEEEEDNESDASANDDQQDEISTGESDTDNENVISTASKHPFETGHSLENEFDSGSFEMKVLSARSRVQHKSEHNDNRGGGVGGTAASHSEHQHEMQNDSGIENCSNTVGVALIATHNGQLNSLDANNKTFDNISDIEIEGAAISLDTINAANLNPNPSPNPIPHPNTNKTMAVNKLNEPNQKQKSRLERRGEELLSKITLDVMSYVLFDFKPIPYELFMKIYGNSNTAQVAVQTHNDRIDQECQCDTIAMQTVWSQCPITYYTEQMSRSDFDDYKNGYGTAVTPTDDASQANSDTSTNENLNRTCENSLNLIHKMAVQTNVATDKSRADDVNETFGKLNIDYGHLNRFLLESEMTLARILNIHNVNKRVRNLNESSLPISNGYLTLQPSFSGAASSATAVANQKIERTFAIDSLPGFLFTLHSDNESKLNVLALWHLSKLNEPVCLLSVWSKILCVEIHPKIRDIVFAGLDDGSIAVWDYSESKYWQPNLGDTIKRFVPSQITTPTFDSNKEFNDFGQCVAIKGLPIATDTELLNGYNPKQLCSLHECGLLILWTVLCNTTNTYTDLMNKRIDHQSLWSKVKLIQNKVIDLSTSVRQMFQLKNVRRPTSKSFDKTRSYFESELFSDAALQELHRMHTDENKLLTTFRCTSIQLTSDSILISTNENFLLLGRKSFKNESFRRIQIDSSKSVRVECMLSLNGFDDDVVVIVLNNGAVKSLCCDLSDEIDELQAYSDIDEASSSTFSSSAAAAAAAADAKASTAYALPVDSIIFAVAPASNGPIAMTAMAAPSHSSGFLTDGNSLGKSCTIQSLVLNERKIYDEHLDDLEYNKTATGIETVPITSMQQKSIRCTQLLNGQTLFSNAMDLFSIPSIAHQHLVKLIKSNKLIILRKNRIRIYDLNANHMIEQPSNHRQNQMYIDATTTTADHNEEYLVLLNTEGIVELHQIKI